MKHNWDRCKNILCIRPDNIGDLLMSSPALRAVKDTFGCNITVLTSSAAASLVQYLPEVNDAIVYDVPWVKISTPESSSHFNEIIERIKQRKFDAAVIFTVYSQNPMPSILLAYLSNIPLRLAYCRENPYHLLTDWVPDKEPYTFIQHQVRRDLKLVESVGAFTRNKSLSLALPDNLWPAIEQKLTGLGFNQHFPWIVLHPGVSEEKRRYPLPYWIETGRRLIKEYGVQLLITGTGGERELTDKIQQGIGPGSFSVGGTFNFGEFVLLIKKSQLLISVNTSSAHIAAATNTPVIVLYALTNPQHAPWKAKGKIFWYDVPEGLRSKNEVVRFVQDNLHPQAAMTRPYEILSAVDDILAGNQFLIPEMIPLRSMQEQVL